MKTFINFLLFFSPCVLIGFLTSFQTKKQEKIQAIILTKVRALPEIKEWFITAKRSKPALVLGEPTPDRKYYSVQVGISNLDRFRTNYWLYVNPKTFEIYYWDQLDTANSKITLQQWRFWRTKTGFKKLHYYKSGKLIVSHS